MTRLERVLLQGSSAAVAVTGGVYAWMKYAMTTDDPYAVVHHPLQPLVLKLHILAGPVLVFAVGMTVAGHVRRQWGQPGGRGRRTGYPLTFLIPPLVITGYLMQAFTDERWLQVLGWIHLALGLLFTVWFGGHRVGAEIRRRRARRRGMAGDRAA